MELALIRDIVTVVSSALKLNKLYETIDEPSTRCTALDDGPQKWDAGVELLNNIDVEILLYHLNQHLRKMINILFKFTGWNGKWNNWSD